MANKTNAFYAQSGGVTAVINATAAGVITEARANKDRIGKALVFSCCPWAAPACNVSREAALGSSKTTFLVSNLQKLNK